MINPDLNLHETQTLAGDIIKDWLENQNLTGADLYNCDFSTIPLFINPHATQHEQKFVFSLSAEDELIPSAAVAELQKILKKRCWGWPKAELSYVWLLLREIITPQNIGSASNLMIDTRIINLVLSYCVNHVTPSLTKIRDVINQVVRKKQIEKNPLSISKFLSAILKNLQKTPWIGQLEPELKELQKVINLLSRKIIKEELNVELSACPLDILTCSTYSTFTTCFAPNGDHFMTALALACSGNIMVATIGRPSHTFRIKGKEKIINHKRWRMLLYVDKNSDAVITGRQYPYTIHGIEEAIVKRINPELVKSPKTFEFLPYIPVGLDSAIVPYLTDFKNTYKVNGKTVAIEKIYYDGDCPACGELFEDYCHCELAEQGEKVWYDDEVEGENETPEHDYIII